MYASLRTLLWRRLRSCIWTTGFRSTRLNWCALTTRCNRSASGKLLAATSVRLLASHSGSDVSTLVRCLCFQVTTQAMEGCKALGQYMRKVVLESTSHLLAMRGATRS
jgi:hypothetical protein